MNNAHAESSRREKPTELPTFAEQCDLITAEPKLEIIDLMHRTKEDLVIPGMLYGQYLKKGFI